MEVNPVIPDLPAPKIETPTVTPLAPSGTPAGEVPTFRDQLYGLIKDVNDKLVESDQNQRDLAMGKTNDLNKVVTSVEEANLALQYTIAIRTKLIDAYQEIARIQM
jgi:flagellar hook-basal body complex protein FliE